MFEAVEIKLVRGAVKNISSVPPEIWEEILCQMETVFDAHPPDQAYGETIKKIEDVAVPRFRFRYGCWRVGYCVDRIFLGKRVVIYCCFHRDIFYDVLKKIGIRL